MKSATILIVDDDPDILRLIDMRLQSAGYNTIKAHNGIAALATLAMQRPDLVITDLLMPELDGMALMEQLHQQHPTLPVIILTAHGTITDAVAATHQGAFSFLAKPFESQVLLQQVANALRLSGLHTQTFDEEDIWRKMILTKSPRMENLLGQAKLIATSDVSVLIQGESGTGKELLGHALHQASSRKHQPFIAINCGAIPENLLESELFGHAKGAFTGAVNQHIGLFQAADGGTLFLDEIGDMPLSLQVKVLRALQERVIRPVGSTQAVLIDVRLISATHRDLAAEMKLQQFREDLFYRINVVNLVLPALQERREDIPLLALHFLKVFSERHQKKTQGYSPEALTYLTQAPWPGNIRQLQNVIEHTVVLSTTPIIPINLVQKALQVDNHAILPFEVARLQFEHQYLVNLLKSTHGNVTQAAKLAQRNRTEFYRLLDRHAIEPNLYKQSIL
ncbi:MAG: two-component system response regulator GlrR [Methylophilaceae bacterium 17-43-7]|nr:MAG: two-component system response regulator GlrR [Methylophilaceae bacterium 17-43-7]